MNGAAGGAALMAANPYLGIAQAGKWDIAKLAFDLSVVGAKACGDIFRARTLELL